MPMPATAGRAYHGKITLSSACRGRLVATGSPEHICAGGCPPPGYCIPLDIIRRALKQPDFTQMT